MPEIQSPSSQPASQLTQPTPLSTKQEIKKTGLQTYARPIGWLLSKMKIATAVKLDGQTVYLKTKSFTNFIKSLNTNPQNLNQTASKLQQEYTKIFGLKSSAFAESQEPPPLHLSQNSKIINKDCQTLQQGQPLSKLERFEKTLENTIASLETDTLSFSQVEEIKMAKKEIKLSLKNETLNPAERDQIKNLLDRYDQFIEGHEVLSNLREFGKKLKSVDFGGFDRFRAIIGEDFQNITELGSLHKNDHSQWAVKWSEIRHKIWNAAKDAEPFLKTGKKITFVTGSHSASMPLILKLSTLAPDLSHKPALVPTGHLIKHNIVPLSGELEVGVHGINKNSLSGMQISGIGTAIGYSHRFTSKFELKETLKAIKELTSEKHLANWRITQLHVKVLQTIRMGTAKDKKTVQRFINNTLKKAAKQQAKNPEYTAKLQSILDSTKAVLPYEFTSQEKKWIDKPFPIVWASVTIAPEKFYQGVSDEHVFEGKAVLGEDIQMVFTAPQNIEKTRELLKDTGVQVYSFDAANYIAHVQIQQELESP